MLYSYNWLKWYLPDLSDKLSQAGIPEIPEALGRSPVGEAEKLADILTNHLFEVEEIESKSDGDIVFDIKILPNRTHDLLSHQGLARELAALLNIKFTDPTPKYKIPPLRQGFAGQALNIKIETDNCRRYMGRIVRNVKTGLSPDWVVKHLESIGQRSINNIVDAANLVMFDCGQPIHCFDLDKVSGDGLIIRMARAGEEMTTLDDRPLKLTSNDMVIADDKNVLGLAGIKGGKIAEVDVNTKNIIIEVANFDPVSVRKSARYHGLPTDAAKHFENELTPETGAPTMREMSGLLVECGAGEFEEIVDEYPQKPEQKTLTFSAKKVSKVLGLEVSDGGIEEILKRYNFEYKLLPNPSPSRREGSASSSLGGGAVGGGGFEITVPPTRLDLALEEDMAEEIGRVLGYDKVKGTIPKIPFTPKVNETYAKIVWARNKLLSEGYSEVMTTSFKNKGKVSVLASASDKNFLRTNLSDGLKESLKLNKNNLPLLGLQEVKIFEIGTVWTPEEAMHVAYNEEDKIIELNLNEFCKDADLNFKLEPRAYGLAPAFRMWPLFPFIARDVAVWVPENISSTDVEKVITANAGEMVVRGPELFDTFTKNNKTSYAFRIVFQSYDRTLTDAEVNEIMNKVAEKIKENKGWQVR